MTGFLRSGASTLTSLNIAFPRDYFDHSKPEDLYGREFEQCLSNPRTEPIRLDFDNVLSGADPFAHIDGEGNGLLWRGWQMLPSQYTAFMAFARAHGYEPVIDGEAYERYHFLDSSYPLCAGLSAETVFLYGSSFSPDEIRAAVEQVGGRAFVKDFAKGGYEPCMLDVEMSDGELSSAVSALVGDRGGMYAGGIAVRQWLGELSSEERAFVVDGHVVARLSHGSNGGMNGGLSDGALANIASYSRFCTVDTAISSLDGNIYVVECGDGQVSEFEDDPSILIQALADAFA